jgi:hypothetical protein
VPAVLVAVSASVVLSECWWRASWIRRWRADGVLRHTTKTLLLAGVAAVADKAERRDYD